MIDWIKVELPLGGIDRKTDAPHVIPGRVTNLENARFSAPGAYTKRKAYDTLPLNLIGGGTIGEVPRAMAQHQDELVTVSDHALHSYSQQAILWSESKGRPPKFHVDRTATIRADGNTAASFVYDPDMATVNGMTVVTWSDTGPSWGWAIIDEGTRQVLSVAVGRTGSRPVPVAVGSSVVIVYFDTALKYQLFSAFVAGASGTLPSVSGTSSLFDVAPMGGAAYFLVAVDDNAGNVDVHLYDETVTQAATTAIVVNPTKSIAVMGTTLEDVYVACDDGTDTEVYVRSAADLTAVAGPTTFATATIADRIGLCRIDANTALLAWDAPPAAGDVVDVAYRTVNDSATVSAAGAVDIEYTQLAARPFMADGRGYVPVLYDDTVDATDSTAYLYEIFDGSALIEPYLVAVSGRGVANAHSAQHVPHVMSAATGKYSYAQEVAIDFAALDDGSFKTDSTAVDRIDFDAASASRFRTAAWGGALFVAGAVPMLYDGVRVFDAGHTMRPPKPGVDANAAAAGSLFDEAGAGTNIYRWRLVWEWTDSAGLRHRSAPSAAATSATVIGTGGRLKADVTIPIIVPGNRHAHLSEPKCYVYRNIADPAEGDATLYYLSGVAAPSSNATTSTYTDNVTDANIKLNEPLYTDGAILDNSGPPPCKTVVAHRERLWVAGLEDAEEIRFSKRRALGLAPEFNEGLSVRIPGAVKITALASVDSTLVAFSPRGIYLINGDGPADTGLPGIRDSLNVSSLTSDVGCDAPRSIVSTPSGVMFQSGKGIYLLDSALQLSKAGAIVDRVLDTYSTVTGAALRANETEVVFAVSDANAGTETRFLVYDYFTDNWSVDKLSYQTDANSIIEYTGAAISPPRLTWTADSGAIYQEQTDYDEGEAWIPMVVETAPIALDTIAGWQKVRSVTLIGRKLGSHSLKVSFEYDNDDDTVSAYTDSVTRTDTQMQTSSYPVKVHLPRQKMRTLRIKVEDDHDTNNEGYSLSSIVLEAGIKRGAVKLPATSKG